MEWLHQPGDIVAERYRILDTLGQGGVGTTYEAEDLKNGQALALKALSLRRMADWKTIELFEREARILSQIAHPRIPQYLDYFQVDTPQDRAFYIVQKLAPGKSLASLVESGWHPDVTEVKRIATQILEILVYLHSLTPPVIHRDLKPQNIIRREDGQIFLVDFGAVQDTYHNTVTGGSTVVGTYGYMAPEQFRGQAALSTDLYGLGTTLLFLLTRKSPAELPQRQLKINFRPHVRILKDFADWLEKTIEPAIEDRFQSAQEALAVLRGEQKLTKSSVQRYPKPKDSPIRLTNDGKQLVIKIPPAGLSSKQSQIFGLIALIWNGSLLLLVWLVITLSLFLKPSNLVFFGVFVLIGLWMLQKFLYSALSITRLEINPENFQLERWLLGSCYQKVRENRSDINLVKLTDLGWRLNKKPVTVCVLRSKLRQHRFGTFLTEAEKEWLVGEITGFLDKLSR